MWLNFRLSYLLPLKANTPEMKILVHSWKGRVLQAVVKRIRSCRLDMRVADSNPPATDQLSILEDGAHLLFIIKGSKKIRDKCRPSGLKGQISRGQVGRTSLYMYAYVHSYLGATIEKLFVCFQWNADYSFIYCLHLTTAYSTTSRLFT